MPWRSSGAAAQNFATCCGDVTSIDRGNEQVLGHIFKFHSMTTSSSDRSRSREGRHGAGACYSWSG